MTSSPESPTKPNSTQVRDVVSISAPADARYVAIVRMTAAAVCSRLGYTVDEVEDLKLAVDEAVSVSIEFASPGEVMTIDFDLSSGLTISVRVPATQPPNEGSYAWGVLCALSSDASANFEDGVARVTFSSSRSSSEQ